MPYIVAMDFHRPLQVVAPTLDGDVLRVLAAADAEFTGRETHRLMGHSSEEGVRQALGRLAEQGIVLRRRAGRAYLYSFNREHVAAPWVMGLVGLRQQLIERIRDAIAPWSIQPIVAVLFGSVARGEAGPSSDVDIFFIRPSGADEDLWMEQVAALTAAVTRWTGNDARALEFSQGELEAHELDEPLVGNVLDQGIELAGSLKTLRQSTRS